MIRGAVTGELDPVVTIEVGDGAVTVLEIDGDPLIGMALLLDNRLTVSARPGGEVLIEEEEP